MTTTLTIPEIIILKLGYREYELVPFLEPGETSVDGDEMVGRAVRLNANSGEEDGRFILAHQSKISAELRQKIVLVFPAWRVPGGSRDVAFSRWFERLWVQLWRGLDNPWHDVGRLVRRCK